MKIKISFLIFLKESLQDVKYDDKVFSHLSLELADRILSSVKEFGYHRYKFIIKVLFIQKTGQAINVSTSTWEHGGRTWPREGCCPQDSHQAPREERILPHPPAHLGNGELPGGQVAPWGGLEKGRSSSDA